MTDFIVDEDLFYYLTNNFDGRHITALLLQLNGPIRRFVFSVEPRSIFGQDKLNYEDIHEWVCFWLGKELRISQFETGMVIQLLCLPNFTIVRS